MPYSSDHKAKIRSQIIEAARCLFNQHGFESVTIDMVMSAAGLTRGGFYNHFKNKEELYGEAVSSFLTGAGACWREKAGVDINALTAQMGRNMINSYLSDEHLIDIDNQCPLIALPSDVARAGQAAQAAYHRLLEAMVSLFEVTAEEQSEQARQKALTIAALCVGGMVLARTLPDSLLAKDVRNAAHQAADKLAKA